MPLFGRSTPPPPAGPGRDAELAPLPGLAEYAVGAGWAGPLSDPGFSQGTAGYVHDMMGNLWGSGGFEPWVSGASAPRYGNTYRGQLQGREFVVTNVFVTMARNTAGAGPGINRPGSVCVMQLGDLLPSLTINLRNRQDYGCHAPRPAARADDPAPHRGAQRRVRRTAQWNAGVTAPSRPRCAAQGRQTDHMEEPLVRTASPRCA